MAVLLSKCIKSCYIIVLYLIITVKGNEDYDGKYIGKNFDFTANKTEIELMFEECMNEYMECSGINRKQSLCAEYNNIKKRFESLCDMEYENCKSNSTESSWHYINDGGCQS